MSVAFELNERKNNNQHLTCVCQLFFFLYFQCRKAVENSDGKLSNEKCQMKTRAKYLVDKFSSEKTETDLIFHLLTVVHDEYYENALHQSDLHYPTFVYEVINQTLKLIFLVE